MIEINGDNPNIFEDQIVLNLSDWKDAINTKLSKNGKKIDDPFPRVDLIYTPPSAVAVIKSTWNISEV